VTVLSDVPALRLAEARRTISRARDSGRARSARVSFALALGLFATFALSMSYGDFPVPLRDVVPALVGSGDPGAVLIVQDIRLPRAVTGVLVGAAFALSGAVLQALARNPLASPDVLGFGAGAAAAAVFVITVVDSGSRQLLQAAAVGGALATALLVYGLAFRNGVSPYRLVLVGIGIGAVAQAVTAYLLTRTFVAEASQAVAWLAGSLNARTWQSVATVGLPLLVLVPAVLLLARHLRTLQLGDETARGLGVPVERARLALLFVCVALIGVGTAAAGPIAYVAFVAPPIARRLTRASGLTLLPAACTGALLVLAADFAAQHFFESELPVGIVTGVIGGTYLLWLVARSNRIGLSG
jgi:iron complex transport system permease protein